jgi:hypothetical protein
MQTVSPVGIASSEDFGNGAAAAATNVAYGAFSEEAVGRPTLSHRRLTPSGVVGDGVGVPLVRAALDKVGAKRIVTAQKRGPVVVRIV